MRRAQRVRDIKLLDAQRFESAFGEVIERGAAHAAEADDNGVVALGHERSLLPAIPFDIIRTVNACWSAAAYR